MLRVQIYIYIYRYGLIFLWSCILFCHGCKLLLREMHASTSLNRICTFEIHLLSFYPRIFLYDFGQRCKRTVQFNCLATSTYYFSAAHPSWKYDKLVVHDLKDKILWTTDLSIMSEWTCLHLIGCVQVAA